MLSESEQVLGFFLSFSPFFFFFSSSSDDLMMSLRSGAILCQLANEVVVDSCKFGKLKKGVGF